MIIKQILFIMGILMFPQNYFYLSFVFYSALIHLYAYRGKSMTIINKNTYVALCLVFCLLLSACIRYLTINCYNIDFRDFFEVGRFLPVMFFLLYQKNIHIREKSIIVAFFIYVFFDVTISYLQVFDLDFVGVKGLVTSCYNNPFHVDNSLGVSRRALGLSTSPGEHGSMLLLIFLILLCYFRRINEKKYLCLLVLSLCMCITGIIFSQSRTSFLVFMISLTLLWLIKVVFGDKKEKIYCWCVLAMITLIFTAILPFIADTLHEYGYLFSLFEYGLENHSYAAREEKWIVFLTEALERPEFFLIGHGKTYFGSASSAMDSEYVFVVCVYGIVVTMFLMQILFNIIKKSVKGIIRGENNAIALFLVTISGLICGISNSFFMDSRILILYCILVYNSTMVTGCDGGK